MAVRVFSEIDTAGELTHEHQVHAVEDFGLERRRVTKCGMQLDGPQVGVETELLADAQQALLGPDLGRWTPLGTADGAQQHRVGCETGIERLLRKRIAGEVDGSAAERRGIHPEIVAELLRHAFQHAHALGSDFGADSVARDDGNV